MQANSLCKSMHHIQHAKRAKVPSMMPCHSEPVLKTKSAHAHEGAPGRLHCSQTATIVSLQRMQHMRKPDKTAKLSATSPGNSTHLLNCTTYNASLVSAILVLTSSCLLHNATHASSAPARAADTMPMHPPHTPSFA